MAGQQQRHRDNYFSRNIQQYGEDFLSQKTAQDLQRDAKNRIFKDIVYGNIDYAVYGKYFMDSRFLHQLLITAQEECNIHKTYYMALQFYDINNPGNVTIRDLLLKEGNVQMILSSLVNSLMMVRDSNYDIGYLPGFSQTISSHCRKCFSDFY